VPDGGGGEGLAPRRAPWAAPAHLALLRTGRCSAYARGVSRIQSLLSLIDRFGSAPCAPADRPRRRLLVGLNLVSVPIGILWGAFYLPFNEPIVAIFPLLHSIGAAINLVIFQRTTDEAGLRDRILAQFLVLPLLLMLALGSLTASSVIVIWAFLAPAGGLVFDQPRRAIRWFVAFLVVLAIGYLLDPYLRQVNNVPPDFVRALFVLNIGTLSAISFGILALFAVQRETALGSARTAHQQADDLLHNMLPFSIAERLKVDTRRIAEQFDAATILFADVVGFTPMSARLAPADVVDILDRLFSEFDILVERAGLEKIKTIGDAYMVAGGVPEPRPDHALAVARLARDMQATAATMPGPSLQLRIGINSGPVVAGVIGRRRLIYDLWGDAVNVASRMESQGAPGRIQLTRSTFELIRDTWECEPHGTVEVKGRGMVETWFLAGERPGRASGDGV